MQLIHIVVVVMVAGKGQLQERHSHVLAILGPPLAKHATLDHQPEQLLVVAID